MSVGAVGGIGMGAAGAMSGGGAAAPGAAGANGAAGAGSTGAATPSAGKNASNPVTSIADLNLPAEAQLDFNSIDLLIALLLMAATKGKKDDDKSAGSTALGFLAGLAMAGALGQMDVQFSANVQGPVDEIAPGGSAGGQLNVQA